jgi:hypothetical protein
LGLVASSKIALKNTLDIMGISAPSKMWTVMEILSIIWYD